MKRLAIISTLLSILLVTDGIYMELTHYGPADQNPLFGNPRVIMTDGTTVLIAAGVLVVVTIVMWLAIVRRPPPSGSRSGEDRAGGQHHHRT